MVERVLYVRDRKCHRVRRGLEMFLVSFGRDYVQAPRILPRQVPHAIFDHEQGPIVSRLLHIEETRTGMEIGGDRAFHGESILDGFTDIIADCAVKLVSDLPPVLDRSKSAYSSTQYQAI